MQPGPEHKDIQPPLLMTWPWMMWDSAFRAWEVWHRTLVEPWLRAAEAGQRVALNAAPLPIAWRLPWPFGLPRVEARISAVPAEQRGGADEAARVSMRMWLPGLARGDASEEGETIAIEAIVARKASGRPALPGPAAPVVPLRPRRGKSRDR